MFQASAMPLTLRSPILSEIYDIVIFAYLFEESLLMRLKQLQLPFVSSSAYSHSDADVLNQSLLEANIATEVCLTVLDTLSIFIMGFKVT